VKHRVEGLEILLWAGTAFVIALAGARTAGLAMQAAVPAAGDGAAALIGAGIEAAFAATLLAVAAGRFSVGLGRPAGAGLVVGCAGAAAALAATALIALVQGKLVVSAATTQPGAALGLAAAAWLLHGFAEEALFRGVLLGAVRTRFGVFLAIVAAGLAWAAYQAWQGYDAPIEMATCLAVGVAFGVLAWRAGLFAAAAAHGAWGFLELELFGPQGLLFVRHATTPDTAGLSAFAGVVAALTLAGVVLSRRDG
jgi:membrane protease YdiL (CAAX protease family)